MSTASEIARTILELGQISAEGTTRAAQIRSQAAQSAADAQARAQQNSGQIWGQTIQSLGQLPGQVYGQMQQDRQFKAQQEQQGLQRQVVEGQLSQQRQAQAAQQRANEVIAKLPKNADGTYDTGALIQGLSSQNVPLQDIERFSSALDGVNKVIGSFNTSKLNHAADLANAILTGHQPGEPVTADSVHLGLAAAQAAGVASAQDVQQLTDALDQGANPETVLKTVRGASEKYKDLDKSALEKDRLTAQIANERAQLPGIQAKSAQESSVAASMQGGRTAAQIADDERQAEAVKRQEAAQQEQARHNVAMEKRPVAGTASPENSKDIAAAIIRGEQPPELTGLYKDTAAVRGELARQGYNQAAALTDWRATQKHIATMNGAQQLRLNQSINALPELLDSVQALSDQWKGGRFPVLNKANLALAKNGVYGPQVASVANQLDSQIADVVADLGNVYMGGNSPTDHALELAGKSLKADWDQKVLKDMVSLAKGNVQIRRNSILNTGVQGASATNPYVPTPAVAPPTGRFNPATGKVE